MNPQKKMVYMQKILNPRYRSSGLSTLNKENFTRIMSESASKIFTSSEEPVKEKHIRTLLIGSYQSESGSFFWHNAPIIRIKEDQIICWKFCYALHKFLRDGHPQVLKSSYDMRQILLDCGNMWRHVEGGYGQLIFRYCTLLYNRINFLVRNPRIPNDLRVGDNQLDDIGERDASVFFDLSCEIFDALDDILSLQELVFAKIDRKQNSSYTAQGRVMLSPLIVAIRDSALLYDYSVKILFKLHGSLPASTLEGHRTRFLAQHVALSDFYSKAGKLTYFRNLIQIPCLTERPPNFQVASDLFQHVAPKADMISSSDSFSINMNRDDEPELLVDLNDELTIVDNYDVASSSVDSSIKVLPTQSNSSVSSTTNTLESFQELQFTIKSLREQLVAEQSKYLSVNEALKSEIVTLKAELEEKSKLYEIEMKKMKTELNILKSQLKSSKNEFNNLQDEFQRAERDSEISQKAVKRLVADLNSLRNKSVEQENHDSNKLIDELNKKIADLSAELNKKDFESKNWLKERELLVASKSHLEQQLDNNQEDFLMSEMNEIDNIIKEASKRIEELSEKSRKIESGIKLQVNEKITEVCAALMKAVRNLIIQSRILQREVVSQNFNIAVNEFYKRNSSWTEGLISAANVVAMAARSLVDCADRAMSGQAKMSELAAAAHEIAAATTQMVVASRVKANKDSEKLKILTSAAKQVNQCTSNVVEAARVCTELIEKDIDKVDISSLSLHQTKKLEMETQVRLLELEDELSKQRIRLGALRRQHYEQEEAQENEAISCDK